MDCRRFDAILADFEEGALPAVERAAAESHLGQCPECRELLQIVHGHSDLFSSGEKANFTRSVLDRTSGSACPRAGSLLWDFACSTLESEERRLVSLHLNCCPACSALAKEADFARTVLPLCAEVDPGEAFTRDVVSLAGTGMQRFQPDFGARLQRWWDRMVRRPLFSFEAAYVATLVMFFAFSPVLPFRETAIQAMPSVLSDAGKPAGDQMQRLASKLSRSNRLIAGSVDGIWEKTELSVTAAMDRSMRSFQSWQRECTRDLRQFWNRISAPASIE